MSARSAVVSATPVPGPSLDALCVQRRAALLTARGAVDLYAPASPEGPLDLPGVKHHVLDVAPGLDLDSREGQAGELFGALLTEHVAELVHALGVRVGLPALLRRRSGMRVTLEPGVTPSQRLRDRLPTPAPARLTDLVALEDNALALADAVLARSAVEAGTLARRGVRSERLHVAYAPVPAGPPPGPAPELPHIGFVADMESGCGWEVVLEALARLKQPWRATVVLSPGSPRGVVERRARARGIAGRVTEQRLEDDILIRLAAAQVVVVAPPDGRISLSGARLPAGVLWGLAVGRPLVAADLPIVRAYAAGAARYYSASDAGALASALSTVLNDVDLRAALREGVDAQRARLTEAAEAAAVEAAWDAALG